MIGLSLAAQARIKRVETQASRSVTFRRLLAETLRTPRRAGILKNGACVIYQPPPSDRLVFDEAAMARCSDTELELAEARQLALASMALPVDLREGELAAVQAQVRVMLELRLRPTEKAEAETARAALAARLLAEDPARLDASAELVAPGIQRSPRLSSLADPRRPAARAAAEEAVGDRGEDARDLSKKLKAWLR